MLHLCIMAKENIRLQAETLFVEECLTCKDISGKLPVSEKTLSAWREKYDWDHKRLTKQTLPETFMKKYDELLNTLLDKRIRLESKKEMTPQDREEYNRIVDEMSKISKIKEGLVKDGKISLSTHVRCVERFMAALHKHNPKLFLELIDFNKSYFTLLQQGI